MHGSISLFNFNVQTFNFSFKDLFLANLKSLYYLFARVVFHARTFWNPEEMDEYKIFLNLKIAAYDPKIEINAADFEETINKVNKVFNHSHIQQHLKRLNSDTRLLDRSKGFATELIRLHEIFEMLAMKWDCGISFNEETFCGFWYAHGDAVKLENAYCLLKAQSMGIPLTRKALEYLRFCDEFNLTLPFSFQQDNEYNDQLDHEYAIKTLTKNIEKIPSVQELEDYIIFIDKSGALNGIQSRYRKMAYHKFIFSKLYTEYPNCQIRLFFLLRMLEIHQTYEKCDLKKILDAAEKFLQKNMKEYEEKQIADLCNTSNFFYEDQPFVPNVVQNVFNSLHL